MFIGRPLVGHQAVKFIGSKLVDSQMYRFACWWKGRICRLYSVADVQIADLVGTARVFGYLIGSQDPPLAFPNYVPSAGGFVLHVKFHGILASGVQNIYLFNDLHGFYTNNYRKTNGKLSSIEGVAIMPKSKRVGACFADITHLQSICLTFRPPI